MEDYRKNPKTLQKYNDLMVHLIIGLRKLENDIRNMSEDEGENKRLSYLRDLFRKIVDANQKLDDMSPLKTEKSATEKQKRQGLKILTP